jgi:hypothetical protein
MCHAPDLRIILGVGWCARKLHRVSQMAWKARAINNFIVYVYKKQKICAGPEESKRSRVTKETNFGLGYILDAIMRPE